MNSIIKQELEKIRAPISEYDDNSTSIYIYKTDSDSKTPFKLGSIYRIELADYLINENSNFTLSANWNRGIVPKNKYMNVLALNIVGTMVQFNCRGFDIINQTETSDVYNNLWLPSSGIKILGEYKSI